MKSYCVYFTLFFSKSPHTKSVVFMLFLRFQEKIMKNPLKIIATILLLFSLCGCSKIGEKNTSLSIIYFAAAIISLLMLIICCVFVRKLKAWFVILFSSVLIVNIGYSILSVSNNLQMALIANRIAYLGSVFLPLSMLIIILNVTKTNHKKWLYGVLGLVSFLVFLIAASPGILDIYYREVSLEIVNGVSKLIKFYGPLHPLYMVYLLGYFVCMVAIIIHSSIKKSIDTTAHAVILGIAVFVNLGVWFIEQLTNIDFEILSVSYIISELFLLGVHLVMNENQRLKIIVDQVEAVQQFSVSDNTHTSSILEIPLENEKINTDLLENFANGLKKLTITEKAIYEAHIARVTTKEILANHHITENTLKFHNKNLYGKLGVASRKELLEVYKQFRVVNAELNKPNNNN